MAILGPFNNVPTGSIYFLQSTGVKGDLILGPSSGSSDATSIRNISIGTGIPTAGQALVYNGTTYSPINLPGTPLSALGFIPNDWNASVSNNNAWTTLNNSIPNTDSGQGVQFYVDDTYYFAQPLRVSRVIRLSGNGGVFNGTRGALTFPTGMNCLILDKSGTSLDAGSSDGSFVDHLNINVMIPTTLTTDRTSLLTVAKGKFYTIPSETRYYLVCTTNGTTNGTLPAALTVGDGSYAPLPYKTVSDGSVVWTFIAYGYDKIHVWQPTATYAVGDMVRRFGDPRFTMVCTVAGTSSATIPSEFDRPVELPGDFNRATQSPFYYITDNDITWRADTYSGLNVRSVICTIDSNMFGGSISSMCIFADGTIPSFVDNSKIYNNGNQQFNGTVPAAGIFLGGGDSNGSIVQGNRFGGLGFAHDGAVGVGIWYHGTSACQFNTNYTDTGLGMGFVDDSVSGAIWINCTSENYFPSRVRNAVVIGGNLQSPYCYRGATTWILPTGNTSDVTGLRDTNRWAQPNIYTANTNNSNSAFMFGSEYEQTGQFAWSYVAGPDEITSSIPGPIPHSWNFGTVANSMNKQPAFNITGQRSLSGPNEFWIRNGGFYIGEAGQGRVFYGATTAAKNDIAIREGIRNPGDRFPRALIEGNYYWDICQQQGRDVPTWSSGTKQVGTHFAQYGVKFADWYTDGTYSYKCTGPGTTAGSEPSTAGISVFDMDPAKTWMPSTRYTVANEKVRPTAFAGNGYKYILKAPNTATPSPTDPGFTIWKKNTRYYANSIVADTSNSGQLTDTFYTIKVQEWRPSTGVFLGDFITPTAAYAGTAAANRIFIAVAAQIGGVVYSTSKWGIYANTGSTEPVWPTDDASYIDDGNLRFVEMHLVSADTGNPRLNGGIQPVFNTATYTSLPLQGGTTPDGIDGYEYHWTAMNMTSGTVEPTWLTGGSDTYDNPSAYTLGDAGFGLRWARDEADDPLNRVLDGTVQWSRAHYLPNYMQAEKLVRQGVITLTGAGTRTVASYEGYYEMIKISSGILTLDFSTIQKAGDTFTVWNNAGGTGVGANLVVSPGSVLVPSGSIYRLISDGTNIMRVQ